MRVLGSIVPPQPLLMWAVAAPLDCRADPEPPCLLKRTRMAVLAFQRTRKTRRHRDSPLEEDGFEPSVPRVEAICLDTVLPPGAVETCSEKHCTLGGPDQLQARCQPVTSPIAAQHEQRSPGTACQAAGARDDGAGRRATTLRLFVRQLIGSAERFPAKRR